MKRCRSICCVFAMALGLSFGVSTDTQAASSVKVIDGSQLTTDAESIGYNQKLNKIAARWPAKAVAQFFTFSKKGSDRIVPR